MLGFISNLSYIEREREREERGLGCLKHVEVVSQLKEGKQLCFGGKLYVTIGNLSSDLRQSFLHFTLH